MNASNSDFAELADAPSRIRSTDRFQTDVTFDMPGADWEYVNAMHARYRFHEHWPAGMLCHITGENDCGIRSIGLWRNRVVEQEYFRKVALEVITKSVHELGPPPAESADGASSFEPRDREIGALVLSDHCDAFADIGPDLDGSAIHALGTQPVIVSRKIESEPSEIFQLSDPPEGLIIAWTTIEDSLRCEHLVWASAEQSDDSEAIPLKRISFGAAELHVV